MGPVDIAIIVAVSIAVVVAVGTIIYKKIKHKGPSCGCGCDGCSGCDRCKKD